MTTTSKRPRKNIRKRSPSEDEDSSALNNDPPETNRRVRIKKQGLDASSLLLGPKSITTTTQIPATPPTESSIHTRFTRQTNQVELDKHMLAYIEQKLSNKSPVEENTRPIVHLPLSSPTPKSNTALGHLDEVDVGSQSHSTITQARPDRYYRTRYNKANPSSAVNKTPEEIERERRVDAVLASTTDFGHASHLRVSIDTTIKSTTEADFAETFKRDYYERGGR